MTDKKPSLKHILTSPDNLPDTDNAAWKEFVEMHGVQYACDCLDARATLVLWAISVFGAAVGGALAWATAGAGSIPVGIFTGALGVWTLLALAAACVAVGLANAGTRNQSC